MDCLRFFSMRTGFSRAFLAPAHSSRAFQSRLARALLSCIALSCLLTLSPPNCLASESDLDDPLESQMQNPQATESNSTESKPGIESNTDSTPTDAPLSPSKPIDAPPSSTAAMPSPIEVGNVDDFSAVQKQFPWIRSVGLVMVSFDDGSFRSGFGLLLPNSLFLTSAELGRNANAYPKNILLKMRDEDALQLICIAELRLKALDKERGLSLFSVSGYTDDHCNLRSQSYYHNVLLTRNAYDIAKSKPVQTDRYYTVTTTFNNPSISVLTLENGDRRVPIKNAQKFVYGRPFFSKSGQLLGMTTLPGNAISPIIVSPEEIKGFLCGAQESGFYISGFVQDMCK